MSNRENIRLIARTPSMLDLNLSCAKDFRNLSSIGDLMYKFVGCAVYKKDWLYH